MQSSFISEIGRKGLHIIVLVAIMLFYAIRSQSDSQHSLLFLIAVLVLLIILEYLRLELNLKVPFFHRFIRPKDEHKTHGSILFFSSTIIALAVFDTPIALAALLMTVFGDTSAAIIGRKYGTTMMFRNKTLAGFIAEITATSIVGIVISLVFSVNIYVLILMAIVATSVEMLIDEMDDNLAVPLISGFIGQLLLLMF
jgi:phytol kinase